MFATKRNTMIMSGMAPILIIASLLIFMGVAEAQQVTDPVEVKALRDVRRKLNDPMKNLRSWNSGDPCLSNWTGILCFNVTQTDGNLHVAELHLLSLNLSGTLSPRIGDLSYLKILDVMWNAITGSLPKEIGKIKSLELLLVNGNEFIGSLPDEMGFLPNLRRIQIDQNDISGPIPKTFANLNKTQHFHMNNNSLSGQIPAELSVLPNLVHFLVDNNNLSGFLPPELSRLPSLLILQVDNNQLQGTIPASYGNMTKLLKLSLRNCSLQGAVPDLSRIPNLAYIDLSRNQLDGSIPSNRLSNEMTTIDLSYNNLSGPIPPNFSGLPRLQRLSLENNSLSGTVSSNIWQDRTFNATESILLDFQNNRLSNISISGTPPANISLRLQGNPVCTAANVPNAVNFCNSQNGSGNVPGSPPPGPVNCLQQSCPQFYEYVQNAPVDCFCAAPVWVGYRLKSPGISDFPPYEDAFDVYLGSGLEFKLYQLATDSFKWEEGPRLGMYLKFYPAYQNTTNTFTDNEIRSLKSMFTGWKIPDSDIFGPYELLNFTLLGPYKDVNTDFPKSKGISKGAVAGIVVGAVAIAVTLSAIISILIMRRRAREHHRNSRRRQSKRASIKIDGVKDFTFGEMELATNNFNSSSQIGQGGYGKVYKGILADGTVVAVKRALEGSLQGYKEFFTEIELLSRVHHRNLVSLIGYCDEQGEQMLVYEYMPNGTLRDHLSVKTKAAMGFAMRLRIAIGSAKGILYLHTEADPPIFHRDIKASNILLDSKFIAKVADFGLSKLAPVPDMEGTTPGHISTVVKGTPGYLDPEYFLTHKLTDKSDVYSLGVVFLELLTGMHPISHGKNIVREVNLAYHSGMIFSLIDGNMGSYPSECVQKFVTLALNCCQDDTDARPSMTEVVRQLENIRVMMPESDKDLAHSVEVESKAHKAPPPSTSSSMNSPFVSADVSGSDLISGVMPSIVPR